MCGTPGANLGVETCLGLLKQPPLWQSSFAAVLVLEDSSPACPAELGKGLLAFIRVLAANSMLCLFLGRWHREAQRCVKDWMSAHSYRTALELPVQQEGWVSGWQMPVTCLLSPEGYWHMEMCLCTGTFLWWPRGVWCGHLTPSWLEGRDLYPPNGQVLLRPMLVQGEGESNNAYAETQMMALSSGCTRVWWCECWWHGTGRDSLLLAALWVLRAPSEGAEPVSWESSIAQNHCSAHLLFRRDCASEKPEMAKPLLLEEYPFIPQNVSR